MNVGPAVVALLHVFAYAVLLLLLGLFVWQVAKWAGYELDARFTKLWIAFVGLITVAGVIGVMFGIYPPRIFGSAEPTVQHSRIEPARGQIYSPASIVRP